MYYRVPAGITSISVEGQEFRADGAGIIVVLASNDHIHAGLAELGCVPVAAPVSSPPGSDEAEGSGQVYLETASTDSRSSGGDAQPSAPAPPVMLIAKPERFDNPMLEKAFLITALEQAGVNVGDKRRSLDVFRALYDETARQLANGAAPQT